MQIKKKPRRGFSNPTWQPFSPFSFFTPILPIRPFLINPNRSRRSLTSLSSSLTSISSSSFSGESHTRIAFRPFVLVSDQGVRILFFPGEDGRSTSTFIYRNFFKLTRSIKFICKIERNEKRGSRRMDGESKVGRKARYIEEDYTQFRLKSNSNRVGSGQQPDSEY